MNCKTIKNVKYCIVNDILMVGDNTSTEGNAIDGSLTSEITFVDRIGDNFVREIGMKSFTACETLRIVNIKYGILKINFDAFYKCKNIVSFVVPSSVSFIAQGAICICDKLLTSEASPGTLTVAIQGPSSLEYLGRWSIAKKDNIIIYYCSSKAPIINYSTFDKAKSVTIYSIKKFSIDSVETTVNERACFVKSFSTKNIHCKRQFSKILSIMTFMVVC